MVAPIVKVRICGLEDGPLPRSQVCTNLGHSIAIHDHTQSSEIYHHEDALGAEDVRTFVGDTVKGIINVNMSYRSRQFEMLFGVKEKSFTSRVNQRPRVSFNERIVPLTVSVLVDLLHVGLPIYLSVCGKRH